MLLNVLLKRPTKKGYISVLCNVHDILINCVMCLGNWRYSYSYRLL